MDREIKPFRLLFDQDLKKSGLTQHDVAQRLNVRQQSISAWRRKNIIPETRQRAFVELFKTELGDTSELWAAYQTDNWLKSMGAEALAVNQSPTQIAAWDRRQEYTSAVTAQTVNNNNWSAQSAAAQVLHSVRKSAHAAPHAQNNIAGALTETRAKHDKFLASMEAAFPQLEIRKSIELKGLMHQFDLVIDEKIYVASAGKFVPGLLPIRNIERYGVFLLKLSALARISADEGLGLTFVVVCGSADLTPVLKQTYEELSHMSALLDVTMPLVKHYNDYMDLVGHIYSTSKFDPQTDLGDS